MQVAENANKFRWKRTMGPDEITEKLKNAVKDIRPDAKAHVPATWLLALSVVAIVAVAATAIVALALRG